MASRRNAGRELILVPAHADLPGLRVLGFDCSSKTVGWGLVRRKGQRLALDAHGHIRPLPSAHGLMTRLSRLYDSVAQLCERLSPQLIAVEDIALFMKGGGSTARTITTLAVFNRVVALAAFRHAGRIRFYPVQSVRKLVRQASGLKGTIGKDDMPAVIRAYLEPRFSDVEKRGGGMAEQTLDEADGIAAAWACAHDSRSGEP
jgi:Holliday junction resolvasome RuvABC endonuclease subunit